MSKNKSTIVVYSGSFNPFHYGHLDILQTLDSLPWVDKVLVVVSPQNPGKSPSIYIQTPTERLEAVKKVISDYGLEKCEASDIEFSRTPPIYTVETLNQIKALYPDDDILYVSGADCLEKIRRWRNARELLVNIGMLVFPRAGYNLLEIAGRTYEKYPEAKIITMPDDYMPREISSTEIRRRRDAGEDYSDLTPVKL